MAFSLHINAPHLLSQQVEGELREFKCSCMCSVASRTKMLYVCTIAALLATDESLVKLTLVVSLFFQGIQWFTYSNDSRCHVKTVFLRSSSDYERNNKWLQEKR